jgi:hypothetical protein
VFETFLPASPPSLDVLALRSERQIFDSVPLFVGSLGDVSLWGNSTIDGYICEFLEPPSTMREGGPIETPSSILSRFLGRSVLLIRKGPRTRPCKPTPDFPNLGASIRYQDGYPLLILSIEKCVVF